MKRTAFHVTFSTTVVLVAAFLTAIFFASPNPLLAASPKASPVDRTEARILELHKTLKITPAQEELWNAFTQVMRENAKTMEELSKARADNKSMNAVEDLKSYSQITDAHAEGVRKFVSAFEGLYGSMSDEQKKNADVYFTTERHGKSKRK